MQEKISYESWDQGLSPQAKSAVQDYLKTFQLKSAVVKVTNRCNLKCSYCYWFRDKSAFKKPAFLSLENALALIDRIDDYCTKNSIDSFHLGLHGGEPLMWPTKIAEQFFEKGKAAKTNIGFSIQTNGVDVSDKWLSLIQKHNINMGISIDGSEALHNEFRIDFKGKGSFDRVKETIAKFRALGISFGVLSVANLESDPRKVLDFLVEELKIKSFDLLVPDTDHDNPPIYSYSEYFIKLYEEWKARYGKKVEIRSIKSFLASVLGVGSSVETIGLGPSNLFVVDSDGSFAQHDVLKICKGFEWGLDKHIKANAIDELLQDDKFITYLLSWITLADKCKSCEYLGICGGGYLPHRWSSANKSFKNPSVYCEDLKRIYGYLTDDLNKYRKKA